jgi:hypothetical protein
MRHEIPDAGDDVFFGEFLRIHPGPPSQIV